MSKKINSTGEASGLENPPHENNGDNTRRHFLGVAATAIGVVGAGAVAWPFISSWQPTDKVRGQGQPIKVDVSRLDPGQQITVAWRSRPIWILRRTNDMLERMQTPSWREHLRDPDSTKDEQQPLYAQNQTRSIKPEYFVAIGVCTHLGCIPSFKPEVPNEELGKDWIGGYFCPCHGSRFDLAGRVVKNVPAPSNLVIPPYHFIDDKFVEIGSDAPGFVA